MLSALVLLATSYLLILPAVTMQKGPYCGMEEHVHTKACYDGASAAPVCGKPEHLHTVACNADGTDGGLAGVYKTEPAAGESAGSAAAGESDGKAVSAEKTEEEAGAETANPEEQRRFSDWVTGTSVWKQSGGQWTTGGRYESDEPLRIYVSFAVPAGQNIAGQAPLTYQLEGLTLPKPQSGKIFQNLKSESGETLQTIGSYTVTQAGLVAFSFDKTFTEDGGAFGGTLFLENQITEALSEQKLDAALYTDSTRKTVLSGTGASVTISGRLPKGAYAVVYPVQAEVGGVKALGAYDITVYRENQTVFEPAEGSPVTVTIHLPQMAEGEQYEVYYIPDDGGTKKQVPASAAEDGVAFDAGHFSVYAVVLAAAPTGIGSPAGSAVPIPVPESVSLDDFSPYNRLQIEDIDGHAVIVDSGSGLRANKVVSDTGKDGDVWSGTWGTGGALQGVYGSFRRAYGALAVQFKGSNTRAANYRNDPDAGWNSADMKLDTTTMQLTVKYDKVGTYDGKPIGAYAVIKITPFKNRTMQYATTEGTNQGNGWDWANTNEYDYGPYAYYPTIQISRSLYSGWVWQNVKEFHVDLSFHYLNEDGSFGKQVELNNAGGSYNSPVADYYTIHSLNPGDIQGDGENPAAHYGPEYVLPDDVQSIKVYSVYDPGKWSSNISSSYTDQGRQYDTQYAYNGGIGTWDGDRIDNIDGWDGVDKPTWLQNSVMIMPQKPTSTLGFTLGNLMRTPTNKAKPHTNHVWACFSTDPFREAAPPPLTDLTVEKKWEAGDNDHPESVQAEIYRHVKNTEGGADITKELYDTVTLSAANSWTKTFKDLLTRDTEGHYLSYTAEELPVPGYTATVETKTGSSGTPAHYERAEKMTVGEKYLIVSQSGMALRARSGSLTLNASSYRQLTIEDGVIPADGIDDSLLWQAANSGNNIVLKNSYYSEGGYLYNYTGSSLKTFTSPSFVRYAKNTGLQIYRSRTWRYIRYNSGGADSAKYYAPSNAENEAVYLYKLVPGTAGTAGTIITITNKKVVANLSFTLHKKNESGASLPGAVFDLYQRCAESEENAVQIPGTDAGTYGVRIRSDLTTDAAGRIKVGELSPSEYYLVETKPPDGYERLDKAVPFTLDESGITVSGGGAAASAKDGVLTVTNRAGMVLPDTGGPGAILYTVAGVLFLLIAGLLYKRHKREVRYTFRR